MEERKKFNAQLSQKIHTVENPLEQKLDGFQSEVGQQFDNLHSRFEKSEISTDILPIFRVSAHLDTIFPSDCRSSEISAFYRFFRRNFGDISGFYRFFPIFPEISATVHESVLFTTVNKIGYCSSLCIK